MSNQKELRDKREIAQSEARDKTAKIFSGLVPGGASAYELFTAIVKPIHEKRKEDWVQEITLRLNELERNGKIDLEELSQNEEFNTIITKATLLAQQNHQKEKLIAFRNIVLNSTKWLSKGESIFDWSHKFLMIVDQISPLHILLLKTFQYPAKVAKEHNYSFDKVQASNQDVFFNIYPELKDRSALANQCWKELQSFGFVHSRFEFSLGDSDQVIYLHRHSKLISQTTDFGNKFLDMIESDE